MPPSLPAFAPFAGTFAQGPRAGRAYWWAALAIVLVAAFLRLVWVQDMEYKQDEMEMWASVQAVQEGEPWPLLGQVSSQKMPAHGMMVWVFLAMDAAIPSHTPTELARLCQCLNVLAIAGLVTFIGLCVRPPVRTVWLWATALAAVNPLGVIFQRKIWAISITPIFLVAVLVGYWHRDRRWGAFLWGALCTFVGMIHAGGLFLNAALAGWAFAYDRRNTRWTWWAAGSAATGWLLIPWILALLGDASSPSTGQINWKQPFTFGFLLHWFTEPFGVSVKYNLGTDFGDFLRYPLIGETPTYLMAVAHIAIAATMLYVLANTAMRLWRNRRQPAEARVVDERSTRHLIGAMMIGFEIVFAMTLLPMHRHYMILTFPIMYVWFAYIALADRRLLFRGWTRGQAVMAASVAIQLAVTVTFLAYVHNNQRVIHGDYGTPYAAQVEYGLPPK